MKIKRRAKRAGAFIEKEGEDDFLSIFNNVG